MARVKNYQRNKILNGLSNYTGEIIDGAPEPYSPDNPQSRAVGRKVVPPVNRDCTECGEEIRYRARDNQIMILATIVDAAGTWVREEVYFPPECYVEAGEPYGPVYTMSPHEGIESGLIEPRNTNEGPEAISA